MYDAGLRWERFTTAREYANQQAEQYRGDLRNMAALTVKKNGLWATTCTLAMALCVALYCAGRLGLHGPSPPTWIMGLWLTNNAAAFGFMAIGIFLSLHSAFRAQSSSVQLLTRHTRVPIPSLKQLDLARKFASEFEQQDWGDIFRIPYVCGSGAPQTDDAVFDSGPDSQDETSGRRSKSVPTSSKRRRPSSWVYEEFDEDRRGLYPPSAVSGREAPEHFKLYGQVQREFYQHDIYARICVFLGFIHYFQSLSYYGLGHINIELRAFWVAYGTVFVLGVLMALVLRFDIIPCEGGRKHYFPFCEYLGPLAILPAAIGMSLDFRVQFDVVAVGFTWVMIFVAYIMQLVYSLRILEVILPDELYNGLGERLGASWLPPDMNKVPSSFYHVLYFVTAPESLQPGQHDLVREIKEGGGGACADVMGKTGSHSIQPSAPSPTQIKDQRGTGTQVEPWKCVAALSSVLPMTWVFLILGNIIDLAIGEQALVTAPHWSRPPMTRLSLEPHELGTPLGFPWKAGEKPWLPEQMAWHEEKRHANTHLVTGPPARRLSERDPGLAVELSEVVHELIDSLPQGGVGAHTLHDIRWPSMFEPKVLACGPGNQLLGLSRRGVGAYVAAHEGPHIATRFHISGLRSQTPLTSASHGPFLGGDDGLVLVAEDGTVLGCPVPRPLHGSALKCVPGSEHQLPSSVPLSQGNQIHAVATGLLEGVLHAAMSLAHDPGSVILVAWNDGEWVPAGEVRVHMGSDDDKLSLSFSRGGDLLAVTRRGRITRWRLGDGTVMAKAVHALGVGSETGLVWHAACAMENDDEVAHLTLAKGVLAGRTMGNIPDLYTSLLPLSDQSLK